MSQEGSNLALSEFQYDEEFVLTENKVETETHDIDKTIVKYQSEDIQATCEIPQGRQIGATVVTTLVDNAFGEINHGTDECVLKSNGSTRKDLLIFSEINPAPPAFQSGKLDDMNRSDQTQNLNIESSRRLPVNTALTVTPLCASSGLGLLASQYDSSEDESNSESDANSNEITEVPIIDHADHTDVVEINSDFDSEAEVEFVSETKELPKFIDVDILEDETETCEKGSGPIRVKGEMMLDDLPPIQDLCITVSENQCVEHGKVYSIIDQLVLVNSIPNTTPLNLDTVLFLDKGKVVLGEIFEVLGQVSSPLYCVRFNSNKQIKDRGIEVGQVVYIAPRTEYTHFVILPDMLKLRGSDASWENDIEPSDKHLDYSDDEEERNAKKAQRNRNRNIRTDPENGSHIENSATQQIFQRQYQRNRQYRTRTDDKELPSGSWHSNYHYQNNSQQYYTPPQIPFIPPNLMQQNLFPPPPPPY